MTQAVSTHYTSYPCPCIVQPLANMGAKIVRWMDDTCPMVTATVSKIMACVKYVFAAMDYVFCVIVNNIAYGLESCCISLPALTPDARHLLDFLNFNPQHPYSQRTSAPYLLTPAMRDSGENFLAHRVIAKYVLDNTQTVIPPFLLDIDLESQRAGQLRGGILTTFRTPTYAIELGELLHSFSALSEIEKTRVSEKLVRNDLTIDEYLSVATIPDPETRFLHEYSTLVDHLKSNYAFKAAVKIARKYYLFSTTA